MVVSLACGCANLNTQAGDNAQDGAESPPAEEESLVERHIEFMKRAAAAGGQERQRMLTEIDRHSSQVSPLTAQVRLGFLLTSPSETIANTREGESMLREILAGHSDLHPALRDLIELRLQEVEVRHALRVELGEAKRKITDLLSIESIMEQKKTESQTRTR